MIPRVAVFKMASCDGCQLQLLDAEEALMELAGAIEIANFAEASSNIQPGPYDVALVEGSISTPEHIDQIAEIREQSGVLIAIGACATAGGIQALRNGHAIDEMVGTVYPTPEYISTLAESTPVSEHVKVDLELTGCPVDRGELFGAIAGLLQGAVPRLPTVPVCIECKRRGIVCVMVTRDEPCLGPVTRTGCGALCPAMGRGCYGCFGRSETPNADELAKKFLDLGMPPKHLPATFRFITGHDAVLREVSGHIEVEDLERKEVTAS